MAAARRAEIGMLVIHSAAEGVARVGAVDSNRVRLDLFDSAAVPIASQIWVDCAGTKRCQLDSQTRVYWQDRVMNHWRAGRIVGGGPDEYFVRPPNAQFDIRVPEVDLRVRWDRPVTDPLEVLLAGAQETPYYRDSRLPVLRDLTAQRSACASVMSAAITLTFRKGADAFTLAVAGDACALRRDFGGGDATRPDNRDRRR